MATKPNAPKEVLEKISQEYEKTLTIPEVKPSPKWMLMPVGLIGSGKTTILRLLAEHFNLIRVSTDEVRKMLSNAGYSYEGCRDIANTISQKYLKRGYSIAVDANTGSEHGIKYNQKNQEDFPSIQQIFIHLNPPVDFIASALRNDKQKFWLFGDGERAVERFEFHRNNFKLPDIPFTYTFDISKDNLDEQIKEGIEAIEKTLQPTRLN